MAQIVNKIQQLRTNQILMPMKLFKQINYPLYISQQKQPINTTQIIQKKFMTSYISMQRCMKLRKSKLQQAHPGYAYDLLQLQMAVEDQKLEVAPSIPEITKLLQLYMIGVEVLQSISDSRFKYFNNKIHSLMMKRHIVTKLHKQNKAQEKDHTMNAINKAELKGKKQQLEINCYFNQGQVDIKKVKEMLSQAETKHAQVESKIITDLKKQNNRLQQRIKERRMRSQAGSLRGSVKKDKLEQQDNIKNSPYYANKDSRFEYFDSPVLAKTQESKKMRNSGSLSKIIDRKYGLTRSGDRRDTHDDAI